MYSREMTFAIISRCDVTALAPIFSLSVLSAVLFDSGNFTYCIMRVMMLSDVRKTRLESLSLSDFISMCCESRARLYKDVISTNQTDETMCNVTAAAAHSAK